MFQTFAAVVAERGSIAELQLPGRNMVLLSETAVIREVMQKNSESLRKGKTLKEVTAMTKGMQTITEVDGESWSSLRMSFLPGFSKESNHASVARLGEVMREFHLALSSGQTYEVQELMTRVAFESICQLLFDYRAGSLKDLTIPFPYLKNQAFMVDQLLKRIQNGPHWKYLPIPANFKVKKSLEENRLYLQSMWRQCLQKPSVFVEILQGLRTVDGKPLSEDHILTHIYGLLGAAFESTGALLHWALYYLSKDLDLQKRVFQEIQRETVEGQPIEVSQIEKMTLLQQILQETMRLMPPFPILIREVAAEIQNPISIKKKSIVFFMIGLIQRDKKIWGEGHDQFRPERFASLSSLQKQSYFPFGFGRRACLGESLARIELPMILASILQRHEIHFPPQPEPQSLLRFAQGSENGISLKFVPRAWH